MADDAARIDNQLRRAAADVEQAAAQLAFILREHGFGRSQRLESRVADNDSRAIDGGHNILGRGDRRRDDVDIYFQALPNHADGIADVVLVIDQKLLRQHVQDFAILRKGDGSSGVHGAPHVFLFDIPRPGAERNSATAVHAAQMAAGDSDHRGFHRHVGDAFSFLKRVTDGAHRGIQIHDEALARPFGFGRAHSQKSGASVFDIRYQRAGLGTADIQRDQIALFLAH